MWENVFLTLGEKYVTCGVPRFPSVLHARKKYLFFRPARLPLFHHFTFDVSDIPEKITDIIENTDDNIIYWLLEPYVERDFKIVGALLYIISRKKEGVTINTLRKHECRVIRYMVSNRLPIEVAYHVEYTKMEKGRLVRWGMKRNISYRKFLDIINKINTHEFIISDYIDIFIKIRRTGKVVIEEDRGGWTPKYRVSRVIAATTRAKYLSDIRNINDLERLYIQKALYFPSREEEEKLLSIIRLSYQLVSRN